MPSETRCMHALAGGRRQRKRQPIESWSHAATRVLVGFFFFFQSKADRHKAQNRAAQLACVVDASAARTPVILQLGTFATSSGRLETSRSIVHMVMTQYAARAGAGLDDPVLCVTLHAKHCLERV
jgi:hypothetical protein